MLFQIHFDLKVPVVVIDLIDWLRLVHAGVVDENVDPTHCIESGFCQIDYLISPASYRRLHIRLCDRFFRRFRPLPTAVDLHCGHRETRPRRPRRSPSPWLFPSPRPPPVTRATFPVRSNSSFMFRRGLRFELGVSMRQEEGFRPNLPARFPPRVAHQGCALFRFPVYCLADKADCGEFAPGVDAEKSGRLHFRSVGSL